jgi:hypothetical protein
MQAACPSLCLVIDPIVDEIEIGLRFWSRGSDGDEVLGYISLRLCSKVVEERDCCSGPVRLLGDYAQRG